MAGDRQSGEFLKVKIDMLEMKENRVYRPFLGGKMLDELSGTEPASDGHYPERWICSTTAASDGTGISVTTDGKLLTEYVKESPSGTCKTFG